MNAARWRSRITLILAIAILIPSLWGFGSKFLESLLVRWARSLSCFLLLRLELALDVLGGFEEIRIELPCCRFDP